MEEKHYHTAGRAVLISYMKKTAGEAPQGAAEIYEGLSGGDTVPGRSSVYRMLAELADEGVVRRYRSDPKSESFVYQYAGERHCEGHFHLQCLSCGKIEHLCCGCGEELTAHLMREHGFAVDSGKTVLYGLCAACAEKEKINVCN